jgi:hypothetical protein
MIAHLLRYQGLAVDDYDFASDAFRSETKIPLSGEFGLSSAFAHLGSYFQFSLRSFCDEKLT